MTSPTDNLSQTQQTEEFRAVEKYLQAQQEKYISKCNEIRKSQERTAKTINKIGRGVRALKDFCLEDTVEAKLKYLATYDSSSYEDLYDILGLGKKGDPSPLVEVSFFGGRYIKINREYISINNVALCAINLIKSNFDFNEEERKQLKNISCKIDSLFLEADELARHKNFLTRFFYKLRSLVNNEWKQPWNRSFKYYTISQFQNVFKISPPNLPEVSVSGFPDRWKGVKLL